MTTTTITTIDCDEDHCAYTIDEYMYTDEDLADPTVPKLCEMHTGEWAAEAWADSLEEWNL